MRELEAPTADRVRMRQTQIRRRRLWPVIAICVLLLGAGCGSAGSAAGGAGSGGGATPDPPSPGANLGAFPLKASANRRYLVNQNNVPFLIMGDSPQSMMANLSTAQMTTYTADRQAR